MTPDTRSTAETAQRCETYAHGLQKQIRDPEGLAYADQGVVDLLRAAAAELRRLEARCALLEREHEERTAPTGMYELNDAEWAALREGRKIEVMKMHRNRTGAMLTTSRDIVLAALSNQTGADDER